jgi:hypothetical protein
VLTRATVNVPVSPSTQTLRPTRGFFIVFIPPLFVNPRQTVRFCTDKGALHLGHSQNGKGLA